MSESPPPLNRRVETIMRFGDLLDAAERGRWLVFSDVQDALFRLGWAIEQADRVRLKRAPKAAPKRPRRKRGES